MGFFFAAINNKDPITGSRIKNSRIDEVMQVQECRQQVKIIISLVLKYFLRQKTRLHVQVNVQTIDINNT